MSYSISKCETFLEFDGMKFMAMLSDLQSHCEPDCYFMSNKYYCNWHGRPNTTALKECCKSSNRIDKRSIYWLRIE